MAHIGDPMRDLGWICTNSWTFGGDQPVGGFGSMEDLFAGYESVTGVPVDQIMFDLRLRLVLVGDRLPWDG